MKKGLWTLAGFILFLLGVLSLILSLVGLQLTPINFIYGKGVITLIIQIIMLFGGIILMYISRLESE